MKEAKKFIPAPGTNPSLTWRELGASYPQEVISSERKQEIFGADIARLRKLFSKHGIETPSNLSDRLLILGVEDFRSLWVKERPKTPLKDSRVTGFTIDDTNTAVFSYTALEYFAEESGISTEEALRLVGIHELLHTLQTKERWAEIVDGQTELKGTRRDGIVTGRPLLYGDDKYLGLGMKRFVEGFTEYLTTEITELVDITGYVKTYLQEQETARSLINEVGFEPVFLAMYTKQGLRRLYEAVAGNFGKYTLQLMLTEMGKAYEGFEKEVSKNGYSNLHTPNYTHAAATLGYEIGKLICVSGPWKRFDDKDRNPN